VDNDRKTISSDPVRFREAGDALTNIGDHLISVWETVDVVYTPKIN
jgi:hypothetical protein